MVNITKGKLKKSVNETAKELVSKVVKQATIEKEQWLIDLKGNVRTDITAFLMNAHGGLNPKTGEYVTLGKRSPKWDNEKPIHNKNIYYEGVGSRAVNNLIFHNLDFLNFPVIIVNNTWEDTRINIKRLLVKDLSKNIRNKCLVFEPHNNATRTMEGKAHGSEFYTGIGETFSDVFVNILGKEYDKEFPEFTHRRFRANEEKEARFGIFKIDEYYGIPTVLAEFLFMDNKYECINILMTEEGRYRIAKVYTLAIVKFAEKF